jgi:hypothetical protein
MRCNISTRRSIRTAAISLCAATAMTSPALAHDGGRHHGECGEHHGSYACSRLYYEDHHHHGGRGHHSDGYRYRDRPYVAPVDDRSGYEDPGAAGAPPSAGQHR